MSNARIERMKRELKADSPRSLLDWLLGGAPKVEQPQPPAPVAAQPEPIVEPVAEPVTLKQAA